MTFGSKVLLCAVFVFIRVEEYHKTLSDVLRKVSVSNLGRLASAFAARAVFDGSIDPKSIFGASPLAFPGTF